METSIKSKWLKALRSGKYRQAMGRLKRKTNGDYSYCCLGVLYKEVNSGWPRVTDPVEAGYLPKKFSAKMGLSHKKQDKLGRMNDGGKSFSDIANWIEKNVS